MLDEALPFPLFPLGSDGFLHHLLARIFCAGGANRGLHFLFLKVQRRFSRRFCESLGTVVALCSAAQSTAAVMPEK